MDEFIQKRIGLKVGERWTLHSVLGVGGMAAVYLAHDHGGAEAAVKVLHPEIGVRADLRERFMREGYAANRIAHDGVVKVLEHGAADEWSVFLVMERLHGESLGERIKRHGALPLPELLDVLDQVLDVLVVAHAAGIVHRDLKPDNLFVTESGSVKVLDFGLARVAEGTPDDVRTRTGMAMGTLPYMAPEQALGKRSEIDGRVDLFALGATAFRILAGRRIHEADSDAGLLLAMATKAAPPLRSVAPHVPENIAAIVDISLAFERDARYPDARTMQSDVAAALQGAPPPFASARLQAREEATRLTAAVPAALAAPLTVPTSAPALPPPPSRGAGALPAPPVAQRPLPPPPSLPRSTTKSEARAQPATAVAVPASPAPTKHQRAALGAAALVLLAFAVWWLWPGSEETPDDVAGAMAAEPQALESQPAERESTEPAPSKAQRERSKKEREKARELQKKLEEHLREREKRAAERRRERDD